MLQEKDLTLDKIQDISGALEATNAQSKSIESRPNMNIGENSHVNKVVANKYCQKGKNVQKQDRPTNECKLSQTNPNERKSWPRSGPNGMSGIGQCFRCGFDGHHPNDKNKCPASGKKCHTCERIGHFSSMCKSQKATKQINSTSDINRRLQLG